MINCVGSVAVALAVDRVVYLESSSLVVGVGPGNNRIAKALQLFALSVKHCPTAAAPRSSAMNVIDRVGGGGGAGGGHETSESLRRSDRNCELRSGRTRVHK